MFAIVSLEHDSYSYAGTGYANPNAVTQIGNGLSTTTFTYDNNGNLTQKTTDGVTTTYLWDYANRLIALGSGGATTTYGYDAFGQRVLQTGTSTTTIYPFKWYSVASSTGSGAQFATTTEYVFNGDALVSTVDQQFASGVATGTAQTRYIHPDHLGSTNVVTNASGTVVQTLDYYPYGSTRISTNVGGADSARKYIGQFADVSGLDYLNARYYNPSQGQFISQDPVFWELGLTKVGRAILADPQLLHSYAYAAGNPITGRDPDGKLVELVSRPIGGPLGLVGAHTFVSIIPDNPKTIGSIPNVNTSQAFTLGGYTNAPTQYDLYKQANESTDYAYSFGNYTSSVGRVVVAPPMGVSQEQFERRIVDAYNQLPGTITDASYGALGQNRISGKPNSNNTASSILLGAGVTAPQINNYQSQLYFQNFRVAPGVGQPAITPVQSVGGRLSSTLSALRDALTQLLGVLNTKQQ